MHSAFGRGSHTHISNLLLSSHPCSDTRIDSQRRHRSRTGAVLHRFAKTADSALFDPHCPHCSTAAHPVLDDIAHVLLDCPRYAVSRSLMVAGFNSDPPLPLPPTLTLSTLLVASPPPPPFAKSLITDLHLLWCGCCPSGGFWPPTSTLAKRHGGGGVREKATSHRVTRWTPLFPPS